MDDSNLVYPMIFETEFSESASIAEAAEYLDDPRTLRQKWDYGDNIIPLMHLPRNFITVCEEI